jgi:hypothetical protein
MIIGLEVIGEEQCTQLEIHLEQQKYLVWKHFFTSNEVFILNFYFHSFKMQQNEIAFMLVWFQFFLLEVEWIFSFLQTYVSMISMI